MDFYYDPILGLQLTFGIMIHEIYLDTLPDSFTFEEWLTGISQKGIEILNGTNAIVQSYGIINTNT